MSPSVSRAGEPDGELALGDVEQQRQHADARPVVRSTLVAPMLPLPMERTSWPVFHADQQIAERDGADEVGGHAEHRNRCHGASSG